MSDPLWIVPGEFNLFAKSQGLIAEWLDHRVTPRTRFLVRILAAHLAYHNAPCVLTDVLRDKPDSVHFYGRGADCRITVSNEIAEQIRAWFNRAFPYDAERPHLETIPELDHGSAPHFHLQHSSKESGS